VNQKKMTWVKESGFIFAMIGSAVGFANILAFSAKCYKNGGGAFLIPYAVAMLVIGIPMLFLEGAIGKNFGLPITGAYGHAISSKWKVFGWIAALSCLTIGSFYSVLTGWSVAYTYFAATDAIPADSATFFQQDFLRDSGSILIANGISWPIFLATIVVAVFAWFVTSKNIGAGVEKVCAFFMPLLFVLVSVFTIATLFLPGAIDGFGYYLKPDFSKLSDLRLWRDAFGQVFFSFSLGLGIVVGYARHTKSETNMRRAMIYVAIGDTVISVISGFAIFGCIGFMSKVTGTPFHDIVQSSSTFEIGFIIFPQILHTFPAWLSPIIGAIFFFCVFIAGITGVFSIVESVAGNFEVEFNLSRKMAVSISVALMWALSTFFCMGNGVAILGAIEPMVMGYSLLIGAIAQVIAFMFIDQSLASDATFINLRKKPSWFYFMAKYVGLAFLFVTLVGALINESNEQLGIAHLVRWTWFVVVLLLSLFLTRLARPKIN
jgi:NSS family neurotransmitter:Na+ symporter